MANMSYKSFRIVFLLVWKIFCFVVGNLLLRGVCLIPLGDSILPILEPMKNHIKLPRRTSDQLVDRILFI